MQKSVFIAKNCGKETRETGERYRQVEICLYLEPSIRPLFKFCGHFELKYHIAPGSYAWEFLVGGGGWGVPPVSLNLELISDQKCHFHTRFQTWPLRNYISSLLGLGQEKKMLNKGNAASG